MSGSVSAPRRADDSTPRLSSLYPQEVQKERHFRPDIQGLRALAVLLVIAAHAGFSTFAGGFVGVDVFFVISGFLITSLLMREATRSDRISLGGLLRPPRPADPPGGRVGRRGDGRRLHRLPPAGPRGRGHQGLRLGRRVRGQHPFRDRRHRLLRPGRAGVPPAALLVAVGGGAVLPRLAAAARRLARLGGPPQGRPAQPDAPARPRGCAEPGLVRVVALGDVRVSDHGVLLHPDQGLGARRGQCPRHLDGARSVGTYRLPPRWFVEAVGAAGVLAIAVAVLGYGPTTPFPGYQALLPVLGTAALLYVGGVRRDDERPARCRGSCRCPWPW